MARTTSTKPAQFKLYAPVARKVSLAGNFNNWDTKSHYLKKDSKGNWAIKVDLTPGKYEYKFVVDGNWINDPSCTSQAYNNFGTQNSIVEIR